MAREILGNKGSMEEHAGMYEDRKEAALNPSVVLERWLSEIDLADRVQQEWREQAQDSLEMYRAEGVHEDTRFNIHYSNVNTTLPTLYSSTPTPDVRQRYADPGAQDEAARIAAQIIERNLVVSMDCYDFDGICRAFVRDGLITGRGVLRVRHDPQVSGEYVFNKVRAECVPWRDFVMGPCEVWEDCPWIAFRHYLTREQLIKLNPKIGRTIDLDHTIEHGKPEESEKAPNVFKRAQVWEIWDKQERKIIWVCHSHKEGPIKTQDDYLELVDFWPIAKPYYVNETSDTMVPIVPVRIVGSLVGELEEITKRIQRLIEVLKWRGFCDPTFDLVSLEGAEDGELVPAGETILPLINAGGLEKAIYLMPIKEAVEVVIALTQQREQTKQLLYEVSGISDIMRGQSDPEETLGAQEIKANFGTLRVQEQQKMVQRVIRDVMRIKTELLCSEFEMDELMRNSGIRLPSENDQALAQQQMQQAQMMAQQSGQEMPEPPKEVMKLLEQPTVEEVEAIVRNDLVRTYVIDVETDSTVQKDMRKIQENMAQFLEGTAAFLQSVGPLVAEGFLPADVAIDLYQPFARSFQLGKQAEDALEQLGQNARESKPQDPEAQAQAAQEAQQAQIQAEVQAQEAKAQVDLQKQQQAAQTDIEKSKQLAQIELQKIIDAHQLNVKNQAELQEMERANKQALAEIQLDAAMAKSVVDNDRDMKRGQLDVEKQSELNRQRTEANDRVSRQKENSDG